MALDMDSIRDRFNIDQQKSNKAADTPRESQHNEADMAATSLQRNFSVVDIMVPDTKSESMR